MAISVCTKEQIQLLSYKGRGLAYGIQMPSPGSGTDPTDVTIYGYLKKLSPGPIGWHNLDWYPISQENRTKVKHLVEEDVMNRLNLDHRPKVHFHS